MFSVLGLKRRTSSSKEPPMRVAHYRSFNREIASSGDVFDTADQLSGMSMHVLNTMAGSVVDLEGLELLLLPVAGMEEPSWRLNFNDIQQSEHKEKLSRGLLDCLGILGPRDVIAEYYQQQGELFEGVNEMDILTYLCWNHPKAVRHIDSMRAYTFGSHYFVEEDIVLLSDMSLKDRGGITGET